MTTFEWDDWATLWLESGVNIKKFLMIEAEFFIQNSLCDPNHEVELFDFCLIPDN